MFESFLSLLNGCWWLVKFGIVGLIIISPLIIYCLICIYYETKFEETDSYKKYYKEYKGSYGRDIAYDEILPDVKKYFKLRGNILQKAYAFSVTIIGIAILLTILMYEGNHCVEKYDSYDRTLYAFQDNQGFYIHGRALGSGSGSDEIVYYYTLTEGNDSFKSYRAKASDSQICYTTDSPYVRYYQSRQLFLDNKWHTFITRKLIPLTNNGWNVNSQTFFVPKGSVENNFNSDLK